MSVYSSLSPGTDIIIESKKLDLDFGLLGKFFGSSKSAASSISWVMIFLFTCTGIAVLFMPCAVSFPEYWKNVGQFITLPLGYLFGRKAK